MTEEAFGSELTPMKHCSCLWLSGKAPDTTTHSFRCARMNEFKNYFNPSVLRFFPFFASQVDKVIALNDFVAHQEGDLAFKKGDILTVIDPRYLNF